jgi:hypothetical protein
MITGVTHSPVAKAAVRFLINVSVTPNHSCPFLSVAEAAGARRY